MGGAPLQQTIDRTRGTLIGFGEPEERCKHTVYSEEILA